MKEEKEFKINEKRLSDILDNASRKISATESISRAIDSLVVDKRVQAITELTYYLLEDIRAGIEKVQRELWKSIKEKELQKAIETYKHEMGLEDKK